MTRFVGCVSQYNNDNGGRGGAGVASQSKGETRYTVADNGTCDGVDVCGQCVAISHSTNIRLHYISPDCYCMRCEVDLSDKFDLKNSFKMII